MAHAFYVLGRSLGSVDLPLGHALWRSSSKRFGCRREPTGVVRRLVGMGLGRVLAFSLSSLMALTACSGSDSAGSASDVRQVDTSAPTTIAQDADGQAAFPEEITDDWYIGVDYRGVSFVDLRNDIVFDAGLVSLEFTSGRRVQFTAAGCGIGSGRFSFDDGRMRNYVLEPTLGMWVTCTPSDEETNREARLLSRAEPNIRVDGDRLLLYTDRYRLELKAEGPRLDLLIEYDEVFRGIETDIAGIEPDQIEIEAPDYSTARITTPTCQVQGMSKPDDGSQFVHLPQGLLGPNDCANADDIDRLGRAFFEEETTLTRNGDELSASNSWGTITFQLLAEGTPGIETVRPPEAFYQRPELPVWSQVVQGQPSTPRFSDRIGGADIGLDLPVPPGSDSENPSLLSLQIGDGQLSVEFRDETWDEVEDQPSYLGLMSIPDNLLVPTYTDRDGQIVQTGETISVRQFRYGTNAERLWQRQVLWVTEHDGQTILIRLEFPELSTSPRPTGQPPSLLNPLAGFTPNDILTDVRFFD